MKSRYATQHRPLHYFMTLFMTNNATDGRSSSNFALRSAVTSHFTDARSARHTAMNAAHSKNITVYTSTTTLQYTQAFAGISTCYFICISCCCWSQTASASLSLSTICMQFHLFCIRKPFVFTVHVYCANEDQKSEQHHLKIMLTCDDWEVMNGL